MVNVSMPPSDEIQSTVHGKPPSSTLVLASKKGDWDLEMPLPIPLPISVRRVEPKSCSCMGAEGVAAAVAQKAACCAIEAACSALAWAASDESEPIKGAAEYADASDVQMERICDGAVALPAVVDRIGIRMS